MSIRKKKELQKETEELRAYPRNGCARSLALLMAASSGMAVAISLRVMVVS